MTEIVLPLFGLTIHYSLLRNLNKHYKVVYFVLTDIARYNKEKQQS